MTRKTRTLIVVGVALLAATIASASVYRAVKRIPVREVEVPHHYVIVAARPLALGTQLTAADLKRVGWPSSSPLTGGFADPSDVVGRGVVAELSANEPILESKLAPKAAGAGLPPAIPPGMRAISVKVNEVIGVAGFATPGARVDVIATLRRSEDTVARVIVPNVRVLAAGTRYDQEQQQQSKPIPATVVTLMVTPQQAEQIALASAEGQLALTLRNPLDVEAPDTAGVRLTGLAGAPAPAAVGTSGLAQIRRMTAALPRVAAPQPKPEAVTASYTVEAIRAGKRSQEVVQ